MEESGKYISKDNLVPAQPCNLCDCSDFAIELSSDSFQFVKCENCGLVFRSQIPSQEHLNGFYKMDYYEKAQSYLSSQLIYPSDEYYLFGKKLMNLVKPSPKVEKPKILDIGCGAGSAVKAFREVGWDALGIDLSIKSVDAGKKLGLNICCGSIHSQDLGIYDVITAFHLFEHVTSPKDFLLECRNKLAMNGLLLIEVPNFGCRRAIKMREKWPYLYPNLHFYQFTESTLKKYLLNTHFKIIGIKGVNGRGPLEVAGTQDEVHHNAINILKNFLFLSRNLVWWLPGAKEVIKNIVWHKMGYGEFLQVLACKQ
jgi:2-polyprenyl-3-methyl-5-hydroxy-6-metoxy-1,4-benzoquinol methylase